jgi:hypothetical protein
MSEVPFRTKPLDFVGTEVMCNYRTGDYALCYEARQGGAEHAHNWIVWRNDGAVLGEFGSQDQARAAIPGFQHQDYLLTIQRWSHALAHGQEQALAPSPLILQEPPNASS